MTTAHLNLKGLSPEQVSNLLPEGLISLCWRGSVAHGMYVPKNDPDSIDDKDVMGIYIGPLEHYLGFGRKEVYEQWEGEWDCVFYELKKFVGLLLGIEFLTEGTLHVERADRLSCLRSSGATGHWKKLRLRQNAFLHLLKRHMSVRPCRPSPIAHELSTCVWK
jgi:predicted nucleotidyltransferase